MGLVCVVGGGTIRAELRRGNVVRWAAEAGWSSVEELQVRVGELMAHPELPARTGGLTVLVEPSLCQLRTLTDLPPLRHRDLVRHLRLSPHRYFRRSAGSLTLDARVMGRKGERRVVAAALTDEVGMALVRGAAAAGLVVEGIVPLGVEGAEALSLLPPDEAARRAAQSWRWTRRLGVAAAIAWVTLATTVVVRTLMERHRIEARLQELQGPVAAVLAAEAVSDSAAEMVRRLDREQRQEGDVVATLFRITLALPDSAFLTQLRVDSAGVGLMAGAARRPTAVLAALESKARVVTPRFQGRTTRDLVGGVPVERFAIGFGEERP